MIAPRPTRQVIAQLRKLGWAPGRTVGSHTMWFCPTDLHQVSVPDGHREISPGVLRKINSATAGCDCAKES